MTTNNQSISDLRGMVVRLAGVVADEAEQVKLGKQLLHYKTADELWGAADLWLSTASHQLRQQYEIAKGGA